MPNEMMQVVATNPNEVTGGGGCICDPEKQAHCTGPYVVFPGNDMENIRSPHVVIGSRCLRKAAALLAETGRAANRRRPKRLPEL